MGEIKTGHRVECIHRSDTHPHQPWLNKRHVGTVLDPADPRAWANTVRFVGTPSRPARRAAQAKQQAAAA